MRQVIAQYLSNINPQNTVLVNYTHGTVGKMLIDEGIITNSR